jgi:prevent-host-death family protein
MERVGLREANVHFAKYMKKVKEGEEILLTDRGVPFAVIQPLKKDEGALDERLRLLEKEGLLTRAKKRRLPLHEPVSLAGTPLTELVADEREERW